MKGRGDRRVDPHVNDEARGYKAHYYRLCFLGDLRVFRTCRICVWALLTKTWLNLFS